jgi:hypothetical protein
LAGIAIFSEIKRSALSLMSLSRPKLEKGAKVSKKF